MPYLKSKTVDAATLLLPSDSKEYQKLAALRDSAGTGTLYEDVPESVAAACASRIIAVNTPAVAAGSDEVVASDTSHRGGTITSAKYFADAAITGANTNTRTLTITQDDISGTTSPARTVTTLCTLAFTVGVDAVVGTGKAYTINSAAFVADEVLKFLSTHSSAGLADPGGLVVVVYTPA